MRLLSRGSLGGGGGGRRGAEMRRLRLSKDKNSLRPPPRNPLSGCHGSNEDGERGWSQDCKWESAPLSFLFLSLPVDSFWNPSTLFVRGLSVLRLWGLCFRCPSPLRFVSPASQCVLNTQQQWSTFGVRRFPALKQIPLVKLAHVVGLSHFFLQ